MSKKGQKYQMFLLQHICEFKTNTCVRIDRICFNKIWDSNRILIEFPNCVCSKAAERSCEPTKGQFF